VLPVPELEYITITLSDLPPEILDVDVLNDAGKKGWEPITITVNHVAYLKRQIEKRSPQSGRYSSPTPRAPADPTTS
jgi:hypothetical protein